MGCEVKVGVGEGHVHVCLAELPRACGAGAIATRNSQFVSFPSS